MKLKTLTLTINIIIILSFSHTAFSWIDGTLYFYEHFPHLNASSDSQQAAPKLANAPQLNVGDKKKFYAYSFKDNVQYIVPATLRSIGKFCYIFVEDAQWQRTVNFTTVENIRIAFDEKTPENSNKGIYQTEIAAFGNPPDIDKDPKIYVLLLDIQDSFISGGNYVAGYFSSVNQQRGVVFDRRYGIAFRSNEKEIIYIDTYPLQAGRSEGLGVLAHELQHLIHWNYDTNEDTWVNEGCAEYAMFLCGYNAGMHVKPFGNEPDVSLVNWQGIQSSLSQYGAVYLFMLYIHEHYGGKGAIKAIVQNPTNGILSINSALRARGISKSFSQIFADWKIANYLDDESFEGGIYGYRNEKLVIKSATEHRHYPISISNKRVSPWAAKYIEFTGGVGGGNLKVDFFGNSPYTYDVKIIEFSSGVPSAVRNMRLSTDNRGQILVSGFGTEVNKVMLVPSLQPESVTSFGNVSALYSYSAKMAEKVIFQTSVIPNPIHARYWDIIAIPSDNIGADTPTVAITENRFFIKKDVTLTALLDGTFYIYQLYLPANRQTSNIEWKIFYLGDIVGEGNLSH